MQEAQRPVFRLQWLPVILVSTGLMLIGALAIRELGGGMPSQRPTPGRVGPLAEVSLEPLGVQLRTPESWPPPVVVDAHRFVLSPDGEADTRSTAGPFLFVVVDALDIFREQLTFRTDLSDPRQQLDALVDALNRNGPRFGPSEVYYGAGYPAAIVRGYERGNELTLILMRTDEGRWVYVGAQAIEADFRYYELNVFKPATDSIRLAARQAP